MADLRALLALYYQRIKLAQGLLIVSDPIYCTETIHLQAHGWLRCEKLSPPPESTADPVWRTTLTRLGEREGKLAMRQHRDA